MIRILLVLSSLLLATPQGFANTNDCVINTAWMHRPPYQVADRKGQPDGFDIQYAKAIAKHLNCKINIRRLPWARQDEEAKVGKQDILLASSDYEGNVDYYVSDPFRPDLMGFYWDKKFEKTHRESSLEDLLNDNLKIAYGIYDIKSEELLTALGKPFYAKKLVSIENHRGILRNMKRGRINGAYFHLTMAEEFMKKNGRGNIVMNKKLSFYTDASFLIAKKSELGQPFIQKLNQAIKELKANGTYDKLAKKYLANYMLESPN